MFSNVSLLFISDADILVKAFWKYKSWKLWPEKKKKPDYIREEKWVFERYILHSFKNGKQLSLMSNQDLKNESNCLRVPWTLQIDINTDKLMVP